MSHYTEAAKLMARAEAYPAGSYDHVEVVGQLINGATAYAFLSIAESLGALTEWLTNPPVELESEENS